MLTIDLNGEWRLTGMGKEPVGPLSATVPGNIELELVKAGLVGDPFVGSNESQLRPYEFYDWRFEREFEVPSDFPEGADLVFEGIDCVAEIELNGRQVAQVENAFIRHTVSVDGELRRGETNRVAVTVRSPILSSSSIELDHRDRALWRNMESLALRKPAHAFGWDICPRCCLGGLWRGVRLSERPANRMLNCYFDVRSASASHAEVTLSYSFATELRSWDAFDVEVELACGDSVFRHTSRSGFTSGRVSFGVPQPKLWWPSGYGEASMYDAVVRISAEGRPLVEHRTRVGLRTVVFEYSEDPSSFMARFVVNGVPIMAKGSNWVPADALHSRDPERDLRILELFTDLGCNMLRVWGGGIYERPEFYDYCDDHGIMVWQDFMIACALAPQTERFLKLFAEEVEWVVKELRQHPCLVLWAGDNEVDAMCKWGNNVKASSNRLTREVIPHVLSRLDSNRPYLPSSPYYSPESEANHRSGDATPEQHIWGPRDYFKSPFYADNNAVFISETGYHGCPDVSSLRRFLSPDCVWPAYGADGKVNDEWHHHATLGYQYRVPLMFKQIREEFMMTPETVEDFSLASQIVQAEAKKFFVENVRIHKWRKAGILWWNMMDCWPQFSDAIVDYYFVRKLAYGYLKRAQRPLLGIVGEWRNWGHEVVMTNDTLQAQSGRVEVTDGETGQSLFSGAFAVGANANQTVGRFELPNCDQRLLVIRWETDDGAHGASHYVTGRTPLDYARYRDVWLPIIKALG